MKQIILTVLSATLLFAAPREEDDFQQFLQEEQGGYTQYKNELEKEFAEYKKALEEEFKSYKKEVGAYWDDTKLDNPNAWTTYSKDKKTRTIVDFEKGEVRIQTQTSDPKKAAKILKDEIERTISIDKKEAYQKDELNQRIEKRIAKFKNLAKGKVEAEPVLGDVFFDQKKPSKSAQDALVKKLLKSSDKSYQTTPKRKKKYVEAVFPLPAQKVSGTKLPKYMAGKADKLAPYAKRYAKKENLSVPLVMAIMHCESAFNPMARSHVPAFGLMQIVPRTAGKDATKYMTGKPQLLSPSYLYNEEKNIQTGSAYLHILYYSYLKKIKNPQSRLYCTIAAYNTGAGNVSKAFTGKTNIFKSAETINRYSPQEVYNQLMKYLPYDETKHYLKRVSSRMHLYEDI